jgi:hypothetical protein
VLRSALAALVALLTVPALALAAEEESHEDEVTTIMILLIVAAIAVMGIVAAFEARNQK